MIFLKLILTLNLKNYNLTSNGICLETLIKVFNKMYFICLETLIISIK